MSNSSVERCPRCGAPYMSSPLPGETSDNRYCYTCATNEGTQAAASGSRAGLPAMDDLELQPTEAELAAESEFEPEAEPPPVAARSGRSTRTPGIAARSTRTPGVAPVAPAARSTRNPGIAPASPAARSTRTPGVAPASPAARSTRIAGIAGNAVEGAPAARSSARAAVPVFIPQFAPAPVPQSEQKRAPLPIGPLVGLVLVGVGLYAGYKYLLPMLNTPTPAEPPVASAPVTTPVLSSAVANAALKPPPKKPLEIPKPVVKREAAANAAPANPATSPVHAMSVESQVSKEVAVAETPSAPLPETNASAGSVRARVQSKAQGGDDEDEPLIAKTKKVAPASDVVIPPITEPKKAALPPASIKTVPTKSVPPPLPPPTKTPRVIGTGELPPPEDPVQFVPPADGKEVKVAISEIPAGDLVPGKTGAGNDGKPQGRDSLRDLIAGKKDGGDDKNPFGSKIIPVTATEPTVMPMDTSRIAGNDKTMTDELGRILPNWRVRDAKIETSKMSTEFGGRDGVIMLNPMNDMLPAKLIAAIEIPKTFSGSSPVLLFEVASAKGKDWTLSVRVQNTEIMARTKVKSTNDATWLPVVVPLTQFADKHFELQLEASSSTKQKNTAVPLESGYIRNVRLEWRGKKAQ